MGPLLAKWEAIPNEDQELCPFFQCLSSVAPALGINFQDYAMVSASVQHPFSHPLSYHTTRLLAWDCDHPHWFLR